MRIRLKHQELARRIADSPMTQNRWALRLGLSSGQLSELVNGKRPYPPAETRRRLLEGLGLEFEQLFELVPHTPKRPRRRTLVQWDGAGYSLRLEKVMAAGRAPNPESLMEHIASDIRFAFRSLLRAPLFSLSAALTLALGIGVNVAIFSFVDAALLKPLPYPSPERLFFLSIGVEGNSGAPLALSDFEAIEQTRQGVLEDVAIYQSATATLLGKEAPRRVSVGRVSANFFRTLGVSPWMGIDFPQPGEGHSESPILLILSHSLWSRLGGPQNDLLGSKLNIDGDLLEIAGILPSGFHFPGLAQAECWMTLDQSASQARGPFSYRAIARLAADAEVALAEQRLSAAQQVIGQRFGEGDQNWHYSLVDLQERFVERSRAMLLLLMAGVAMVLLIATVNVANLALTRAYSRLHEIAVRSLLGAGRWRLAGQFLSEGLMLASLGGLAGCLLAGWLIDWLSASYAGRFEAVNPIQIDWRTLLFGAGASMLCGVLFSMAPLWRMLDVRLLQCVRTAGRGTAGPRENRIGRLLIASEFALALMLLVGAGLLAKSLFLLTRQDPGFRPQGVVSMNVFLPPARYPEGSDRAAFYDGLLQEVRALPGVSAAGLSTALPPDRPYATNDFVIEGQQPEPGQPPPIEILVFADEQYFEAAGIAMQRGRSFVRPAQEPLQAIVDEGFARKYLSGQDPLGKRLRLGSNPASPWLEIVGIASSVKYMGLNAEFRPTLYVPFSYYPPQELHLVVRSSLDPSALASSLRRLLSRRDASLALSEVHAMEHLFSQSAAPERFRTLLMGAFAALALALSSIGIYAVISYGVSRRVRETGIRMALGAAKKDVLRLMLMTGLKPALAGLVAGSLGAVLLSQALSSLLYGVRPLDLSVFGAAWLVATAASLAACLSPARRASALNPADSLRCD